MSDELRELLYQCIRELSFIQCVENCHSGLCATANGEALVDAGIKALGIKDLSAEKLHPETYQKAFIYCPRCGLSEHIIDSDFEDEDPELDCIECEGCGWMGTNSELVCKDDK